MLQETASDWFDSHLDDRTQSSQHNAQLSVSNKIHCSAPIDSVLSPDEFIDSYYLSQHLHARGMQLIDGVRLIHIRVTIER